MIFNPNRLSIARKRRMLNKKALASLTHVRPYTIVRWESCQSTPTEENVDALAVVLGFPRGFFFGPDVDEPSSELTSFRSQTSMSAAERDAALAAGQIGFMIWDWVASEFNLPQIKLPDLRHCSTPESAAYTLRQEWAMGDRPIFNMIQLLESKGVRVFSLAENTSHVNAYSLWRRENPYVFLNTFKSGECSRFDAAHELAHLVLHQDGGVTGREAEDQANRFASAFLMPESDVIAALPRVTHLDQLVEAKAKWKVSVAALNYRLHRIGITTEWKNRDLCIEIAKAGYNTQEPNSIEREKSVVWEKVLRALWADQMTPDDLAQKLMLPAYEVSDLLFGVLNVPKPPIGTALSVVPRQKDLFDESPPSPKAIA